MSQDAPLWRWKHLVAALQLDPADGPDVLRLVTDSRTARPGDLFVALPGDPGPRFNTGYRSDVDGHDFVADAVRRGAVGALVHRPPKDPTIRCLLVEDTYDGLWRLGSAGRRRFEGDVVGITGSSGKTTAKFFIAAALQAYAPPGSHNNHIGVPLALANLSVLQDAGVFEVGTNHPGEVEPLSRMLEPDVAILLNVHNAHIENFSNHDALVKEKLSIFNGLENKSNSISEDLLKLDFGVSFGLTSSADARVYELRGNRAHIHLFGRKLIARVPGGGAHRANAVAAALLTLHLLGRELDAGLELGDELVPAGRGTVSEVAGITIVDDSYNANPESMRAALASFASRPEPHKVLLLGEMLELGTRGPEAHLALSADIAFADHVLCVGDGMAVLADQIGAPWFEAAGDCVSVLREALQPGSALLVKGSNRVFWQQQFVAQLSDLLE